STSTTPGAGPLTSITVNFNEPIDPATLVIDAETAARSAKVVNVIDHSLEYFTDVVAGDFVRFLKRTGSATEIAPFATQLSQGSMTDEQVIASIVGSQEYFQNRGNSDNTRWFITAYADLTGQGPTQAQINVAISELDTE